MGGANRKKEKLAALIIFTSFVILYLQAVTFFIAKSYDLQGYYPFYYGVIWALKAYNANAAAFYEIMKKFSTFLIIPAFSLLVIAKYRYAAHSKQKLNKNLHGS